MEGIFVPTVKDVVTFLPTVEKNLSIPINSLERFRDSPGQNRKRDVKYDEGKNPEKKCKKKEKKNIGSNHRKPNVSLLLVLIRNKAQIASFLNPELLQI